MVRPLGAAVAAASALLLLSALLAAVEGELQKLQQPAKADGSLAVLVVGDWGRRGQFNQSLVAAQMGRIGEQLKADFVISTGDNFYDNGLTGVNDEAFAESFSRMYTAQSLQKPWYAVLGNHDYHGNVLAQLSPDLRKVDDRFICKRSYIVNTGIADFFFVDTTPFVRNYWGKSASGKTYDWRDVAPRRPYIAKLLKDLKAALTESTASWKIVVGHHTLRSASDHGDTPELVRLLLPILKASAADLYVNGHDHCLQHISSSDSPLQYLTSGAGSQAWRGTFRPGADPVKFFYDGQGFMSFGITKSDLDIGFYDVNGHTLYQWKFSKVGKDGHPGF